MLVRLLALERAGSFRYAPRYYAKLASKASMARANPKTKRKLAVTGADSTEYPFLHVGHGTSRCSDDLSIWLLFTAEPDDSDRCAIEAAMPEILLREARSQNGKLRWSGPLLHVNSGMDFKYSIAEYDPHRLAWLDTSKPIT